MIRYSLLCDGAHAFEGWFRSSGDFDEQAERGLVACPHCGSAKVGKALMTPALGRADHAHTAEPAGRTVPESAEPTTALPMISEPERRVRSMLRALREHVTASSDHVGRRFAEEARAIHYGEKPHRSIYGEATGEEARALIDEGIDVAPLPPAPDDRN